jgi:hypothetical protein
VSRRTDDSARIRCGTGCQPAARPRASLTRPGRQLHAARQAECATWHRDSTYLEWQPAAGKALFHLATERPVATMVQCGASYQPASSLSKPPLFRCAKRRGAILSPICHRLPYISVLPLAIVMRREPDMRTSNGVGRVQMKAQPFRFSLINSFIYRRRSKVLTGLQSANLSLFHRFFH